MNIGPANVVPIDRDDVPREPPVDIFAPDVAPGSSIITPPTFATEPLLVIPANFDELPPAEQARILSRFRFGGIKCRPDIKDKTIPITRETLDIP